MWGPGLAKSDVVTFFAVLAAPSFMAPRGQNNSKFSNFLELITILSLCYTVGKVKEFQNYYGSKIKPISRMSLERYTQESDKNWLTQFT